MREKLGVNIQDDEDAHITAVGISCLLKESMRWWVHE